MPHFFAWRLTFSQRATKINVITIQRYLEFALARAMALDPDVLFFDEPSAGLDPISTRLLNELIIELRDSLGATILVVTHDLASIFMIANNSVFLDGISRRMIAQGDPRELRDHCDIPAVKKFLRPELDSRAEAPTRG